ncbi:MAG: glycosyltransferase family 2 protein [Candidatus Diapherotrites archaeon]
MKREKLISVIVVNYNGENLLEECLSSLSNQTHKKTEIILVDNASKDNSIALVKNKFPGVKIIRNKTNEGFAAANNIGIEKSMGSYVAMLNNDAVADRNWLEELVKKVEKNKKIGLVGSKILRTGSNEIDTIGLKLIKSGYPLELKGDGKLFGVDDCACLYRREMLEDIRQKEGIYDNDFFIYFEDADISIRALLRGWNVSLAKEAVVFHKGSVTVNKKDNFKKYLVERNIIWFITKNFPRGILLRNLVWIVPLQFGILALNTLKGNFSVAKAKFDAMKDLPKILKKREIIQESRKISDTELLKIISNQFLLK